MTPAQLAAIAISHRTPAEREAYLRGLDDPENMLPSALLWRRFSPQAKALVRCLALDEQQGSSPWPARQPAAREEPGYEGPQT